MSPTQTRIKNLKQLPDREKEIKKKKEELDNDIVRKNPYLERDKRLETQISRSVLEELKKMSEKNHLNFHKEYEEDKQKRKVKFSQKQTERYVGGLKVEEDESMKRVTEEKISIGNETFFKSDCDMISKKVLQRCNFFHSKNKNNNSELRSGVGKLMITGGLSISDFLEKYNLKNK